MAAFTGEKKTKSCDPVDTSFRSEVNEYFSLPAGIAHSPVARRVKETQFRVDKSQGDNML